MSKSYCVEGIYCSDAETTMEETFSNEVDARNYYESLILELKEEYGNSVHEVIDYITIYCTEGEDYLYNIETYTYDLPE